jgi:penicillin-binding protein 1A
MAQKAGIRSPLPAVPSLALGTGAVSLYEMMGFYQAIANGGVALKPLYIKRIEDRNGKVLEEMIPDAEGMEICTPENAEIMIEMLRGVVNEGTAAGLRRNYAIPADIAGKTGTTQKYSDGWFIGFTPGLVAGAWVGGDLQNIRFQTMQFGQGAYTAMPIWAGFMNSTLRDGQWSYLQKDTFAISPDVVERLSCDEYRENRPFQFRPIKILKEKKIFRNLFKKKKR